MGQGLKGITGQYAVMHENVGYGEEEVKLSPSADDKVLYIENSKDSTRKLLELIKLAKLQSTRSTHKYHLCFYKSVMNN